MAVSDRDGKKHVMARKKYIRDYRLVETVDERGRIRSDYEYIGADYVYCRGADAVRRDKKAVLCAVIVGWLAFAGALLPPSAGMHAVYVALPFLFSAVPLGVLTDTLLTAARSAEPLRHQQADMLENRYPAAALWTMLLPCAALLGELVCLLLGARPRPGDAIFSLCAALTAGAGLFAFLRRRRFLCRKK